MSATRLLALGVVRIFGSAHGYLIHNELYTWGAHEWANVKWGSIYHALRQMAKKGLLVAHEMETSPWRVDYTITDEGNEEFLHLLREALRRPEPRPDMVASGLAFLTALPRQEAVSLLRERADALRRDREEIAPHISEDAACQWEAEGAGHVPELFRFWHDSADHGLKWTEGLVERLEAGAYVMAGESPTAFGTPGKAKPSPTHPDAKHGP
ncbi:MAG: PadR family transcriptional regulator [Stackebrandtia sp.]